MSRRGMRLLLLIAGAFVALVVATIVCYGPLLCPYAKNPFNDHIFVRSVWLSSARSNEAKNPRGPMAEDLRSRHLPIGMTKRSVRILLGKPDNSQYDESRKIKDHYFLGHWGSSSIDGDYLIIHYDEKGRLKSTEIYEH